MGILLTVSGYLADMCQVKGYLTTTQVRKYFNCGGKKYVNLKEKKTQNKYNFIQIQGFLGQTIFLMAAAYIMNPVGTITCIIIAIGLGAFAWCGFA